MSATPPERLTLALADRYRIEREVGAGGMATVYLARDLKHNRAVALKVLKPELAAVVGAERFLAEIETTANLQHPHILPLYDSGEVDSFLYYVMPFVEGESLRDRLDREKELPVDEAVRVTTAVAQALDFAHGQGVVHRDIKPANILFQGGQPVVADFGIALAVGSGGGARLTETGLSLGTPFYMSPEQATGDRAVGARSDIYALGCVLYEMLAGEPPYTGSTAQAVLGKIISGEPVFLRKARPAVPSNVDAGVRRALERVPADRFATAAEFGAALADPGFKHGDPMADSDPSQGDRLWKGVAAVMTVVAALAVGAALWSDRTASSAASSPAVPNLFELRQLPPTTSMGYVDISVDGSVLSFDGSESDEAPLLLRRAGQTSFEVLEPDPVRFGFVFSPDGDEVAYTMRERGFVVFVRSLVTGERRALATFPEVADIEIADWSEDGRIYATRFPVGSPDWQIVTIDVANGRVEEVPLPELADGLVAVGGFLLDDVGLVLTALQPPVLATVRVMAYRFGSGDTLTIATGASIGQWSPSGHIIYGRDGGFLEAVPFDLEAFEIAGDPVRVLTGLQSSGSRMAFAMSPSGDLVWEAGPSVASIGADAVSLEWVDPSDGSTQRLAMSPTDHDDARLSPDGTRIAYVREGRLWIYDTRTEQDRPLDPDAAGDDEHDPVWSPDGGSVLFSSERDDPFGGGLYLKEVDSGGPSIRVGPQGFPMSWQADGVVLYYTQDTGDSDIYALRPAEPDSDEAVLASRWNETILGRSSDGRWMAYIADENGTWGLYVRRYPDLTDKLLVTEERGFVPMQAATWGPDGRSVSWVTAEGIRTATLELGEGPPRVISTETTVPLTSATLGQFQDRDPETGRFLRFRSGASGSDESTGRRLMMSTDWVEDLRRRFEPGG